MQQQPWCSTELFFRKFWKILRKTSVMKLFLSVDVTCKYYRAMRKFYLMLVKKMFCFQFFVNW